MGKTEKRVTLPKHQKVDETEIRQVIAEQIEKLKVADAKLGLLRSTTLEKQNRI